MLDQQEKKAERAKTQDKNLFVVNIVGTRPLLISSAEGVSPRGPMGDRLRYLNGLRKATEADKAERDKLKYLLALYIDPKIGPYVPGYNFWAACRDGGVIIKSKTAWIRGSVVMEDKLQLKYDGPRDAEALYADPRFVDSRPARVSGKSSIIAVRPIFHQWSLRATVTINDEAISLTDAKRVIELTGELIGIGTFRQRFGRFEATFE